MPSTTTAFWCVTTGATISTCSLERSRPCAWLRCQKWKWPRMLIRVEIISQLWSQLSLAVQNSGRSLSSQLWTSTQRLSIRKAELWLGPESKSKVWERMASHYSYPPVISSMTLNPSNNHNTGLGDQSIQNRNEAGQSWNRGPWSVKEFPAAHRSTESRNERSWRQKQLAFDPTEVRNCWLVILSCVNHCKSIYIYIHVQNINTVCGTTTVIKAISAMDQAFSSQGSPPGPSAPCPK